MANRAGEERLTASYLRGDPAAVSEIEGWIRALLAVRYRVVRADWDDLVQLVHTKLLANLVRGEFTRRSSLKTYVQRIAQYSAVDLLRRRHRESGRPDPSDPALGDSPYLTLIRREQQGLLHAALHLTSPNCLALWRMIFLERRSYEQVAAELGIPEGTVKSQMWHCRKKLGAILRRLEGGRRL